MGRTRSLSPSTLTPTRRLDAGLNRVSSVRCWTWPPLVIDERLVYRSELVTNQRHRGKTNERLTRAMLISHWPPPESIRRSPRPAGHNLNWALAYASFIQTWAKRERLPHKMQRFKAGNAKH